MYALVCLNEEHEIVDVKVSKDINVLRELMRKEYDAEHDDAINSGYPEEDMEEMSFIEEDYAYLAVEDDWSYEWSITECKEM